MAKLLLAPLVVFILALASVAPFHSAPSVDSRTYIEMVRGVVDHGLPYMHNGPVARFGELQARWNYAQGDKLWGALPPVFPYAAAPFLKLGGLRAVTAFNVVLLALMTLGAFGLGARVMKDPLMGTLAAYFAAGSTPVGPMSIDIGPYMLAITLVTWSAYFVVRALDEPLLARRHAASAGLLGGLAIGSHLLTLAMVVALMALLWTLPVEGSPRIGPPRLAALLGAWTPTRASIPRGVAAVLGACVPLAFVAYIDHARFGSFNPVTYGPCVWRSCEETGLSNQHMSKMFMFVVPALAWLVLTLGGLVLAARKSKLAVVGVLLVSAAFAARSATILPNLSLLAQTAGAFVFDTNHLDIPPFDLAKDGLGHMAHPFVLKSPMQQVPFLALGLLAPFATTRERQMTLVLAVPPIALLCALSFRANMPAVFALGFPFMSLRYVFPAFPLLIVLALTGARRLQWRRWHLVLGLGVAVVLGFVLASDPSDEPLWRRVLILRSNLALAAVAVGVAWLALREGTKARWRGPAALVVAAIAGIGFSICMGIDLRANILFKTAQDTFLDDVGARLPQRFALVGWAPQIDTPLALRASRDIEYADLYEATDWGNFYRLIEVWTAEERPIYALWPLPNPPKQVEVTSPWADVSFDPVEPRLGLVRVVLHRTTATSAP